MTECTTSQQQAWFLYAKYPLFSQWEFALKGGKSVEGEIYCIDPEADLIVVQDVENGITMISLESIEAESPSSSCAGKNEENTNASCGTTIVDEPSIDVVHAKKTLEDREKRAIRLAQESLKHLNPKALPKGQLVFDRLLKACNEVVWKSNSIVVLDSIVVDPPYTQGDCKILAKAPGKQGSLDRVQKIVSSISRT
ncbi:unnamed protein product [Pseudo-nitzschia multistriata]|uniref:AD domain-containing protein n=1 Tax=Pseudo-nitzschia multistriata TaxID=183589 RepID=A0A448Z7P4_9STRA|nr:unnamed protein product [Pseudo-nitzschia multistriata]